MPPCRYTGNEDHKLIWFGTAKAAKTMSSQKILLVAIPANSGFELEEFTPEVNLLILEVGSK